MDDQKADVSVAGAALAERVQERLLDWYTYDAPAGVYPDDIFEWASRRKWRSLEELNEWLKKQETMMALRGEWMGKCIPRR